MMYPTSRYILTSTFAIASFPEEASYMIDMLCAVCHVALDLRERIDDPTDVAWIHPLGQVLDPSVFDHEPVPVEAAPILEARYHCDFCNAPAPSWRYVCESFVVDADAGVGSDRDWAACDTCYRAIEARDLNKLAYRSTHGSALLAVLRPAERADAEQRIRALHRQFLAHRTGVAVRL